MASSESREILVLQKYRTRLVDALSQCIDNVLPDLQRVGAITNDQQDKIRKSCSKGPEKTPADGVEYLLDNHIKKPDAGVAASVFPKLLEVMKKIPHCKALAMLVEHDLKSADASSEADEVTRWIEKMGNNSNKQLQEVVERRLRRCKLQEQTDKIGSRIIGDIPAVSYIYDVDGYYESGTGTAKQRRSLIKPLFLAKGHNDELFVRDYSTQRLVVYTNYSDRLEYSHFICGKGDGNGLFQDICGIAVTKEYLYVADCKLHCIQKLRSQNGSCVATIGRQGKGNGEFEEPFGIAVDENKSRLYVCDYGNHRIQIFENDEFINKFGGYGSTKGYFKYPGDITLNKSKDQLFITDLDNHRVQMFKTDGICLGVFGDDDVNKKLRNPFGIFFTQTDMIMISSVHDYRVYMADADGTYMYTLSQSFNCPCGVLMMNDGQLVVAEMLGNKLTVI